MSVPFDKSIAITIQTESLLANESPEWENKFSQLYKIIFRKMEIAVILAEKAEQEKVA